MSSKLLKGTFERLAGAREHYAARTLMLASGCDVGGNPRQLVVKGRKVFDANLISLGNGFQRLKILLVRGSRGIVGDQLVCNLDHCGRAAVVGGQLNQAHAKI